MRELRFPAGTAGPFAAVSPAGEIVATGRAAPPARFRIGRHVFAWTRHLLTGVGVLTIGAFIVGTTSIPEQIGDVTGRIASSTTRAQIESQSRLQGAIAAAQQQAAVDPQRQLQTWQADLQADIAALSNALDGAKNMLVQKATADLQGRNMLLQTNAQLQADRVRQIMQIQEQLERGNITSAQFLDMARNFVEAIKGDASNLRQQSKDLKIEVLSEVTKVTPISPDSGAGVTDPLKPGGVLDPDVQVAMADLQRQVAAIQQRFAVRAFVPSAQAIRP